MLPTKIGQCEFPFHTLLDELVNLVLYVKKLCHQCHFPVVLNLPIYSGMCTLTSFWGLLKEQLFRKPLNSLVNSKYF